MPRATRTTSKASRPSSPISFDDNESLISEISVLTDSLSQTDRAQLLETAMAKLPDRRGSNRVEGLTEMVRQLSLYMQNEFLEKELSNLQPMLMASLKRSLSEEVAAACHIVELIAVTMGVESDGLLNQATPILRRLSHHGDSTTQSAALRALGTVQLITSQHVDEIRHSMATFTKFFKRADANVATAAIGAWNVLATRLPFKDLADPIKPQYLPLFMSLLKSGSIDVRSAAGESVALMFEAEWRQSLSQDDNEDESAKDSDQSDDDHFTEDNSDSITDTEDEDQEVNADDANLDDEEDIDIDDLTDLLSVMATDGSKSRARQERCIQRSVFRSVLSTVEDGSVPKSAIKIGKNRITFNSWSGLVRLATFRTILAQGFYRHITSNDIVRQLLLIPSSLGSDLAPCLPKSGLSAKSSHEAVTMLRQQKKKADRNHKNRLKFTEEE